MPPSPVSSFLFNLHPITFPRYACNLHYVHLAVTLWHFCPLYFNYFRHSSQSPNIPLSLYSIFLPCHILQNSLYLIVPLNTFQCHYLNFMSILLWLLYCAGIHPFECFDFILCLKAKPCYLKLFSYNHLEYLYIN